MGPLHKDKLTVSLQLQIINYVFVILVQFRCTNCKTEKQVYGKNYVTVASPVFIIIRVVFENMQHVACSTMCSIVLDYTTINTK